MKDMMSDIHDKYGDPVFSMAMFHLLDVGARHFTDDIVEKTKRDIRSRGADADGDFQMTPELQCAIVDCAAALSKIDAKKFLMNCNKYL